MIEKLSRVDLMWGYLAHFLKLGAGLLLLPVIMIYLTQEEVGLWFVFLTLVSLSLLLELGFQPTIVRNISYIYSGADKLSAEGYTKTKGSSVDLTFLSEVVVACRQIYRIIALCSLLILFGGGSLYINSILSESNDIASPYLAWFCFSGGAIINFYFGYYNSILQGRGDISQANKVIVVSQLTLAVLGALFIVLGFRLLGVGVASLLAALFSRLLAHWYVFSGDKKLDRKLLNSSKKQTKKLVAILWHNSSRFGVVALGVFLIWRANILVASSLLGLNEAGAYALAIYIFSILNNLASVPLNLSMPRLNSLKVRHRTKEVFNTFSSLLVACLSIYSVGFAILFFIGADVLVLVGSELKLPNQTMLFVMGCVFLLELNHGLCANYLTTENRIPFMKAALISGILIVFFSTLSSPIWGVACLVLSQGAIQLLYNNWKWPHEVGKEFKMPYFRIIAFGVRNACFGFKASYFFAK